MKIEKSQCIDVYKTRLIMRPRFFFCGHKMSCRVSINAPVVW